MTPAHAFDTLAYARKLKAVGVDEAQAEAHAEAVRDAVTEGVATKADLDNGHTALRTDLENQISALKKDLENQISALRLEVKAQIAAAEKRQTLTVVTVGGLVVAAVKLIP